MKRPLLAALLMMAAPAALLAADSPDPLATIDTCIKRLDPQLDVGYERVAARCPDLTAALERSGWAAWLPRGWKEPRNDLSAGSLAELRATVQRELAPRTAARTLEVARLKGVLSELGEASRERSGVWARFKQWLRSLFQRGDEGRESGGLRQLLDQLGVRGAILEILNYFVLALCVALAGVIVFNELRAAGVLRGQRSRGASDGNESARTGLARPTLSDLEQAAHAERPRLLLELIAAKLTDLRRLPPAGAFTVREITRAAQLPEEPDRSRLSELALTAERARFAAGSIEPAVVDSAVAHGRALLTSLDPTSDAARAEAAT
jgi:hypothetical protein